MTKNIWHLLHNSSQARSSTPVVSCQTEERHSPYILDISAGRRPDIVLLTEATIAGGTARSMAASSLKDIWIGVAHDQGIECADIGAVTSDCVDRLAAASSSGSERPTPMLIGCGDGLFLGDLMKAASRLLHRVRRADGGGAGSAGLVCVTGSLHMVSSVLQQLEQQI
jgi:hypothetical protein